MVMILFILCPSWRDSKLAKIVREAFLFKITHIHSILSQESVLRVVVIFFSRRANSLALGISQVDICFARKRAHKFPQLIPTTLDVFVGSAARHRASLIRRSRATVTSLLLSRKHGRRSIKIHARFSCVCIEKYTRVRDRRHCDHKSRTISMLMRNGIGNRPVRSRVDRRCFIALVVFLSACACILLSSSFLCAIAASRFIRLSRKSMS